MVSSKLLLAAAFLTSPAEPDAFAAWKATAPVVYERVLDIAVVLELLDPKGRSEFEASRDRQSSLCDLRRRYVDLWDAPGIDEALRFPPPQFAKEMLTWNRAYRSALACRAQIDMLHRNALLGMIHETDQLYRVWVLVADIRDERYWVANRRSWLRTLRDLIGPRAFYSGNLPPGLPTWHLPPE